MNGPAEAVASIEEDVHFYLPGVAVRTETMPAQVVIRVPSLRDPAIHGVLRKLDCHAVELTPRDERPHITSITTTTWRGGVPVTVHLVIAARD